MLTQAPLIQAKMAPLHELHCQKKLSDCELTALFIIQVLSLRYPGDWLGAKRIPLKVSHTLNLTLNDFDFEPNIKRRLAGLTLGDLFTQFALKSTPEAVNRSLLSWSTNAYPLVLMFRIPMALEVLNQQKQGRRCVTVLTEASRTSRFILGERDTLSFTMHDLIHADHFYHHNECYQGQLALYGFLFQHQNDFAELLKLPKFHGEFEYLIADMNAYAIHSLKCLKSAIVHYGSAEFFENWVQKFSIKDELLALNSPEYIPEKCDAKILKWLDQFTAATSN